MAKDYSKKTGQKVDHGAHFEQIIRSPEYVHSADPESEKRHGDKVRGGSCECENDSTPLE